MGQLPPLGYKWFNPDVVDKCYIFVTILDNLDKESTWDRMDDLDIAHELYQTNRKRYPVLISA